MNIEIPPAPLAPSVEKAYYRKCIALKRRLNEVESANDSARLRRLRLDRAIMKMRLERAFLLDELRRRMEVNIDGSEGSGEEGAVTPPTKERPLRDKRRGGAGGRTGSGSVGQQGGGGGGGFQQQQQQQSVAGRGGEEVVLPQQQSSGMEQIHSEQQQQQRYAQGQGQGQGQEQATPSQVQQHGSPYATAPPPSLPPNGLPGTGGARSERVNSNGVEMGGAPPVQIVGNGEGVEGVEGEYSAGEKERNVFTAVNQ